jgi:hypothetical protein
METFEFKGFKKDPPEHECKGKCGRPEKILDIKNYSRFPLVKISHSKLLEFSRPIILDSSRKMTL